MRRNILRLSLAVSLLIAPSMAGALGQIAVEDTIAGFDTRAALAGLPPTQTIDVHVVSPSGDDTTIPVATDTAGSATVNIPARLTAEAGGYRVFAVSGRAKITKDAVFQIVTDRVDPARSSITVSDPFLPADGSTARFVTVTLRDAQGNPLPGRPVQLVGSRAQDRISGVSTARETDRFGRQQFAVQTDVPGEIVLRAMDFLSGTILQNSAQIAAIDAATGQGGFSNVPYEQPQEERPYGTRANGPFLGQLAGAPPATGTTTASDILTKFGIDVSTTKVNVSDVLPLVTITALGARGTVMENFTGNVHIRTPNDPRSVLPGNFDDPVSSAKSVTDRFGIVTFAGKHRGTFPLAWVLSFGTPGQQVIEVSDESGTIKGQAVVSVTGNVDVSLSRRIQISSPKDGETLSTRDILISGNGPALVNLSIWTAPGKTLPDGFAAEPPVAQGETDDDGAFTLPVQLPEGTDTVLYIQDDSGQYDSGPIRVRLDTVGPAIDLSLSPPQPKEGESVTVTVQSEPSLPQVLLRINDQEIALTETDPGTYVANIVAPGQGTTEFTIEAVDPAGNIASTIGTIDVAGPDLPIVQNVRTQSLAGAIRMLWDAIPDPAITSYRIEVGRSPGRSDITQDADASGDATVPGLKAGIDYFLTVRAMRGGDQGPRSATITARTLGMEISVTPQENSLLLQWTFPDTTPLRSFVLNVGRKEGQYEQERVLDGGMRVYTLDDLMPIPYFVQLTPITTTGIVMSELTVAAAGTPLSGFHPSGEDTIGSMDAQEKAPSNDLHASAPEVSEVGFPGIPARFVLALTVVAAAGYVVRRKKALRETQKFLGAMQKRYHQ